MEMRHHAGAKVGVLVIDEQQDFSADPERQSKQKSVPRTAAILGCPVWFAEIGGKEASDTHEPLIRAAGFRSCEAAQQAGTVLKKRNKTNAFEGSNLGCTADLGRDRVLGYIGAVRRMLCLLHDSGNTSETT